VIAMTVGEEDRGHRVRSDLSARELCEKRRALGIVARVDENDVPLADVNDAEVHRRGAHEAVFDDAHVGRGRRSVSDLSVTANYRVENRAKTGGDEEDYACRYLQGAFEPGANSEKPHFFSECTRY
jgi:hypothetical protein